MVKVVDVVEACRPAHKLDTKQTYKHKYTKRKKTSIQNPKENTHTFKPAPFACFIIDTHLGVCVYRYACLYVYVCMYVCAFVHM